jgi:hypothetical protein
MFRTRAFAVAAATAVLVIIVTFALIVTADPTTTTFPPSSAAPTPEPSTGAPETAEPSAVPPTAAPVSRPKPQTVPLDRTADLASGTTVRVVKVEKITGEAELPGEVGGPAISVDISLKAGQKIDFATAVVNAYYGSDDTPATPLTKGSAPFVGTLQKGKSAKASYVFRVPEDGLSRVTIELDLSLDQPITLFRGAVGS